MLITEIHKQKELFLRKQIKYHATMLSIQADRNKLQYIFHQKRYAIFVGQDFLFYQKYKIQLNEWYSVQHFLDH